MNETDLELSLLASAVDELEAILQILPNATINKEYLTNYLFSRIPQKFSSNQLPLFSLSIIQLDANFEVTVNLRSTVWINH